jgi:hypothetical protein
LSPFELSTLYCRFSRAADFITSGLWEVVGTPTEGVFSVNEIAFQVTYEIILCIIDKLLTMIILKFKRDQFHNQFLNCGAQGWGIISVKSRE